MQDNKGMLIWTEGGKNIGMGHVMRSLSVAYELRQKGYPVTFMSNRDEAVYDAITSDGYHIRYQDEDIHGDLSDISAVIFDSKRDISEVAKYFKDNGKIIILIDNETAAVRNADIVIIPTFDRTFRTKFPVEKSRILCGPEYFPLNHHFTEIKKRKRSLDNHKLRVLVTMGGADPNRLTTMVVNALSGMEDIELKVVLGPATGYREKDFTDLGNLRLYHKPDIRQMAALMNKSDIAFTAVGITLFELAYMGVPAIVIGNYAYDKKDMNIISNLGIGISLGYVGEVEEMKIFNAVNQFINNRSLLKNMSLRSRKIIDGKGRIRVTDAIQRISIQNQNSLKLEKATVA